MYKSRSLRFYLAVFALVIAVPLLAAVTIATYQFALSERTRLEGLANSANQDIVMLVNHEIATKAALLQALAIIRSVQPDDIDRFERHLRDLARLKRMHFVLFDRSGQQLVNTGVEQGLPLSNSGDPEFHRAFETRDDLYVSNLFTGRMLNKPMLQVAVPVRHSGEIVAILSSTISTERLSELLKEGMPAGPFFGAILDRNGTIIARSMESEVFVGTTLKALSEGAKGSKGSLIISNSRGIPIFAFWRRPEVSGWVIAAAVDHAALTAPLADNLKALAVIAALLAVLAVAGAVWVGRRITGAQKMLMTAAEAVGNGRVIDPPQTHLDESDRVGHALSNASCSIAYQAWELQVTNQELEQRVEVRTQELRSKTALLETTLDTMVQGLIVIDANDRVPICNTQARKLLDLPDDLMAAQPTIDDLLAFKESRGEFVHCSSKSIQLLRPKAGDELSVYELQRPNGTVLQISTVPVRGGAGFVRTYTDITIQRRHDRELETAKDAAEAANRAKGDFLANISHEMRSPLNAMIGYSDLLVDNAQATPDLRRYAARIHSAGVALLSLVDDVLELGKIEAGIIDIREEPFALETLINDAVSIARPSAHEHGLAVRVRLDLGDNGHFVGDQDRLRQILLNLLNNAIKFTPSGTVTLSVQLCGGMHSHPMLRFAVADTGIGIAETEHASLFQRFHQVDPSMSRRFGGAGLGLAISKQLVERLGGRIGMESELGRGSTFWFEITLVRAEPVADEREDVSSAQRGNARILVAEDVTLNQELAREFLEAAGHQVEIVSNGVQAVEAAKSGSYDMLLMDLSMPEMDGLTATRHIRAAGIDFARMPIVACTANVLQSHVSAFREAGVDAYLRKPLLRKELYGTIDRLLRGPARAAASRPARQGDLDIEGVWNLISLLGPKRVIAALESLNDELSHLALAIEDVANPVQHKRLAEQAHAIISTACMLELTELAERCRELENACRDLVDVAPALKRLAPVITNALAQGQRLRQDLERYAA